MEPELEKIGHVPAFFPDKCRAALLLWLRWNNGYEQLCQNMFEAGRDQAQVESLMTQLDELRKQAVAYSREIVDACDEGGD